MKKKPLIVYPLRLGNGKDVPFLHQPFKVTFIKGSRDRSKWREESRKLQLENNQKQILDRNSLHKRRKLW